MVQWYTQILSAHKTATAVETAVAVLCADKICVHYCTIRDASRKKMTSEQWRCFAVKNKDMKRIKNQFWFNPLQSTESALYENHCCWRIKLWVVSGQGTQLVNDQQHVTQLRVGRAWLKRRIFTVPRVTDLFVVNWSKSNSEYSLKITTVSLVLRNRVSACICYVLQCSVLCLFMH